MHADITFFMKRPIFSSSDFSITSYNGNAISKSPHLLFLVGVFHNDQFCVNQNPLNSMV